MEALLLALLSAVVLLPEILLRKWWVDDAAITFAYARNLVNGDGLVAFAGGERAEGYSDPLWMALLALGQAAHLDPFVLSKVLGGLLAAATVPLAWAIARWMPLPDRNARSARLLWMLVAALVATNAQHGIWACAGLENSLMSFLLAVGTWRLLVETEDGGIPWSALVFVGVALTHSEGVIYGAFAFLLAAWGDWHHGRRRRILAWVAIFGAPLLVYQFARYAYFALPYPLPYYAKLQQTRFSALNWNSRCWTYLRHWGTRLGWAYLLPVLFVGVGGLRGWRLKTMVGLAVAAVALLLLPGGAKVNLARVGVFSVIGIALPLLALRRRGIEGPARLLFTGFTVLALAFSVKTNGDWMSGFRRFSSLVLPLMMVYVTGLALISRKLPWRWARMGLMVLLGAGPMVWNLFFTVRYARHPTGMTPMTTRTRVREFNKMARTLHLDRPWVAVDHAMGGQMWFAPPTGRVIDWYGLTDVASALARSTHGFDEDYLLKPPTFDLAHIEKGLRKSKLYNSLYVEVPRARGRNKDNWVARSLLSASAWPDDGPDDGGGLDRAVQFDKGHQLVGFTVRSPEVYPAGGAYLELGLSRTRTKKAKRNFTVQVKLSGPATATIEISPGYKRLYPPAKWPPDQVFIGRYDLALPDDLPTGTYDMGFTLVDKAGRVEIPVTGPGEVTFPSVLQVVSEQDARAHAQADWQRAIQAAKGLDCETADRAWKDALEHLPLDDDWERTLHKRAAGPLANCWAARASNESDLSVAVEDLRRARRWDVRSPPAAAVGATLADAHWDEAMAARAAGDPRRSLDLFEAIVHADPTRSWARRYAEDARATILAKTHSK